MGTVERLAELDRQERDGYPQTWRVINERRRLVARQRRSDNRRGRRKQRNLRAAYRQQEKQLIAAVAGLKSATALLDILDIDSADLDSVQEEQARELAQRARNALAFATDGGSDGE